jgi:hypothetical protein
MADIQELTDIAFRAADRKLVPENREEEGVLNLC